MRDKQLWWGYSHINGNLQAKRYWGDKRDLDDAYESDFVEIVVEPFEASSREEALAHIQKEAGS
jgi:hypothetical protein